MARTHSEHQLLKTGPRGARYRGVVARVKLLKALINLIVATLVGAAGDKLLGAWGMVLGFIAGGLAAWWIARRVFDT